ncbi:hypothetical protein [Spiroplasma endosymbiont of Megaselia nigra]|uniref:hypothetical protein n=1 Tax=Spiroplasma endosymbiont of Megaselia nigra TaxID=2478537 RepID=UPI000F886E2F|nr:hypothetical protein [Spiroplasma endosymbiont of Megaselia nigra]RUO86160.1 hypothetical protein D9R21_04725 [Spiroplasma endosymbiont of Megaselia nigra]
MACNKPQEYTKEQLDKLKEKYKINTDKQEIKDNLEWIAPQESPFNEVDNKYYFVVWLDDKENNWKIIKLKNDIDLYEPSKWKLDESSNYYLGMGRNGIYIRNISGFIKYAKTFNNGDSDSYFKVYRWNINTDFPNLVVDSKTGEINVEDE